MASEKTCFKCLSVKPLEEFYVHPMMADGHLNKCKDCTRSDVALHRAANLEKIRAYDNWRALLPHRIELRRRVAAEYDASYPERKRATRAVNNAIRDGRLKKQPCHICGEPVVEAHHPDYSAPLDVVWLCVIHHRQLHGQHKKAA